MADNSPRTDTSTDLEADAKLDDGHHGTTGVSTASDHETTKNGDSKVGLESVSVPHCVTKCSSVHSGKPLKFSVCM
jgi:hypothetical protein